MNNHNYYSKIYLPQKQKARETYSMLSSTSQIADILQYLEDRKLLICDEGKNASSVHAEVLLGIKEDDEQ